MAKIKSIFKCMSIEQKLTFVTLLTFVLVLSISTYLAYLEDKQHFEERLEDLGQVTFNQVELFRMLAMENQPGHTITRNPVSWRDNLVAYNISDIAPNAREGLYRLTSLSPLNKVNNSPDSFERESLVAFSQGSDYTSQIISIDSQPYYRYIQPLFIEQRCQICHNDPQHVNGDIRGAISLILPIKGIEQEYEHLLKRDVIADLILFGFLFIATIFTIRHIVIKPLNDLSEQSDKIGSGELAKLHFHGGKDQISHLTQALIESDIKLSLSTAQLRNEAESEKINSLTDPLTGVYNRRYLDSEGVKFYSESIRTGLPVCTLSMDIDYFKNINDTYGHTIGDECLKHLCNCVGHIHRDYDRLIRMGGEEFLLIMPDTTLENAKLVAERIRHFYEETPFISEAFGPIKATLSIGLYCSAHTLMEEAIKLSDQALYKAKHNGRNQVQCHTEA